LLHLFWIGSANDVFFGLFLWPKSLYRGSQPVSPVQSSAISVYPALRKLFQLSQKSLLALGCHLEAILKLGYCCCRFERKRYDEDLIPSKFILRKHVESESELCESTSIEP